VAARDVDSAGWDLQGPLALLENEVHIVRIQLTAVAAEESRWQEVLTTDERERADRFHFEIDRRNFTACRALLRVFLGAFLQQPPPTLRFSYSAHGKPELAGLDTPDKLRFNVSHSGGLALLGFVRGRRIGIDVEAFRRDADRAAIVRRFFSSAEQQAIAALPEPEQEAAFFACWTRKEAFIKAKGDGLSLPLAQFDVSVGADGALLATRPHAGEVALWRLRSLQPGAGFAAAVAVEGEGWTLRDWASG
jgi:4'-phosphopantetheinyl transferase